MSRATVRMILTASESRVLVTDRYGRQILKARLAAASQTHRLAARTLLEALALFCNDRLRVVLSAESEETSCAQGLSDGFGFGIDTLYYEVDMASSRAVRRRDAGSFRDDSRLPVTGGDKT